MNLIPNRLRHQGLFIQMFLVTTFIVVFLSGSITYMTIQMSEDFFIEKYTITNTKVVKKIKDSFESYHYSIVLASNNLLQSGTIKRVLTEYETNYEKMISFYTLHEQMNRVKSNVDAYEVAILIRGYNGVNYSTDRAYWPMTDKELSTSPVMHNTLNEPRKLIYQTYETVNGSGQERRFIVASKALMERISGRIYGSAFFAIDELEFKRFYEDFTSVGNDVFIVNATGTIVSSNYTTKIGAELENFSSYKEQLAKQEINYVTDTFMGKERILLMEYIPSLDMYLFNVIDEEMALGSLINKRYIMLVSIVIAVLSLVIVFLVTRKLTTSLSDMVKQISDAPTHHFHQYVSERGTYETKQIGRAFNSMLDELHQYVEELILIQKQKRNAELAALQQQINPHFMYNTLTSIKFMVHQNEKEETEKTIDAFISLLQNTVGNVDEVITVHQEIENLRNYALIKQRRYGDRIQVSYLVSPDCNELLVPKLFLQPFVENAFFHAFSNRPSGNIRVLIWKEGEQLVCEVVDNGNGMDFPLEEVFTEANHQDKFFSGIGVRNVHDRIQFMYGGSYGVTVSSKPNEGTVVRVTLPLSSKNSANF